MLSTGKNIIFILTLLLISCPKLWAQDTNKHVEAKCIPDFCKIQFAGNIGFISVGGGYSLLNDQFQSSIFYSYIPKHIAGINIHTVALKNSLSIYKFKLSQGIKTAPYFGCSLSYSGYLPLQVLPHLGLSLSKDLKKKFKSVDIYFETGTTGKYLKDYFNNRSLGLYSIVNFAVGTSIYF